MPGRRAGSGRVREGSWLAFPVYESVLLVNALVLLPMSNPVLRPAEWVRYAKALHLYDSSSNSETESSGVLPQFYADRFGWQEEVDQISRVYRSLTPEERGRVAILCSNYGEAGAVDFLGRGLPPAISGQNNYYLWGPRGATGELVIVVNGASLEEMREVYAEVEIVGRMDAPYSMPYERRNIYLARGRRQNLSADWAELKHYI